MNSNECQYCDKLFSTLPNLFKHYRNVHKIDKNTDSSEKVCQCDTCGKEFASRFNLNRHMANQHESTHCSQCGNNFKTRKELNKHNRECHYDSAIDNHENDKSVNSQKNGIKCDMCSNQFSCNSTLFRHKRQKHGAETSKKDQGNFKCSECGNYLNTFAELDTHLEKIHFHELNHQSLSFHTLRDFKQWKRETEETQRSYYFLRNCRENVFYYRCSRAGPSKKQSGWEAGQRIQWAPEIKTGNACPARMVLRRTVDGYRVDFQEVHVGHKQSVKYLRLARAERIKLAGMIEGKMTMDAILDEIMDNVKNYAEMTRYDGTTRKDLHNIMQEFNLVESKLCQNDFISTETWVKTQMAHEHCCVIAFKQQGEVDPNGLLHENDFVLIVMTKYQEELLMKYAKDAILVDSTHKMTGHDFQLTSLVTVDNYATGCPVAFCLSSRIDTNTMVYFFQHLKNKVGVVNCVVFMSDDYPGYYNSWTTVMSVPKHHLLCTWHVDKNWRDNIRTKVQGLEKQADVYKGCRMLLESMTENDFIEYLQTFLDMCENDPETLKFGEYFKTFYANRANQWAYCYRKKLRLNTNMFLEALHKKLKHCYLNGKQNRRVDRCIDMLLRVSRRLMHHQCVRNMKNIPSHRMNNIAASHKRSLSIKEEQITRLTDNKWQVKSSTEGQGPYIVQVDTEETCNGCLLNCPVCKICIHQFECDCVDYNIRGNFCKHIHACVRPIMEMLPETNN